MGLFFSGGLVSGRKKEKKMASYLHRTAQPSTLATFRFWGSSTGAGRIRLAAANIGDLFFEFYEKTQLIN